MAKGKKKGAEFALKSTSVTYNEIPGAGGETEINLEGTATGFGTVLGTMSLWADGPGAETGRTSWVGAGYLDNGEVVQGTGDGFYEKTGKHKWRVRSIVRVSTGALLLSDGVISLDGRSYKGTLTEWS